MLFHGFKQPSLNNDVSEVSTNSCSGILYLHRLQMVAMGGKYARTKLFLDKMLNFKIFKIPDSSEGKVWYSYVDENVTPEVLQKLTDEYLQILERSPSKFKSKMKAITSNGQAGVSCIDFFFTLNLFWNCSEHKSIGYS